MNVNVIHMSANLSAIQQKLLIELVAEHNRVCVKVLIKLRKLTLLII